MQFRSLGLFGLGIALISAACSAAQLQQAPGSSGSGGDPQALDDGGTLGDASPRTSPQGLDGGALPVTSLVTLQVIPSDNGAAVLAAIKGATTSVHMTMYLLSDTAVINALIALKTAGKDVKVILNQNFPGGAGSNAATFTKLQNAGVDVRWAPSAYTYTHAKTVVLDGAKVLIMTMNLTQTSASQNREYIATDSDPQDVAEAEAVFQADYANKALNVAGKLLLSPRSASSPDARTRLIALIDSATKSLDVEGETLSDDPVVAAIIAAKQAGVAVRVVIDQQTGTPAQLDSIALLKQAGVPLVALGSPTMHAKAIVADGARVYVGSMNFTANSLNDNREMGLITDVATEVAKVQSTIAKDFAVGKAL